MGDNIRNYLESWRSRYSYPNYIGDNQFLTSDGKLVEDNLEGYSEAQETLLKGSAIGTASNYFLDPHPLFNRLGEIYSNILDNKAYSSARTDSIKMNRLNMDYTNGKTLRTVEKVEWDCFKFISATQTESIYGTKNGNTLNNILNLVLAFKDRNPNSEIIEIDVREVTSNEIELIKYYNKTLVKNTLGEFNDILKEEKIESKPSASTDNNRYFLKLRFVDPTDGVSSQTEFTIPSKDYYKVYATYKNRKVSEHSGLQLLMPRYARRVEVEDLDENFWVIGQILDAIVKALWGPYGLIDVVRQIIYEVNKDKREDNVNDIKLLHDGSDDLYFDMYSRFTMNDLQLKLITDSGERIIKDIFKPHTNKSDRKINGKDTTTNGETSVPALFEEITEEMYGETYANDTNTDGTNNLKDNVILYGEGHKNFTGLFDSDLARSVPVPKNLQDKEGSEKIYVSLSTVIDAINDNIVADDVPYSGYYYAKKANDKIFFDIFDPTLGDNTFSGEDYQALKSDVNNSLSNVIADKDMVNRLAKYEKSYNYLKDLKNPETDWPDFIKDYTKKIKLDLTGGNVEENKEENKEKAKEEVLKTLYTEVSCQIPYVYLEYLMKLEGKEKNSQHLIIEKINNELDEIFAELTATYNSIKGTGDKVLITKTDEDTEESINNLYNRYLDLTNLGETSIKAGTTYYIYNTVVDNNKTTHISDHSPEKTINSKVFKPVELTSFNPILRDTIPIYSINVASKIANDIAQPSDKKIITGKYTFIDNDSIVNKDILKPLIDEDVVETFFDIYKDGEISSRDPARVANFGANFGNSNYWNDMVKLEEIIENFYGTYVIKSGSTPMTVLYFFNEIFDTNFITPDGLKRYIFTYIDNPLLDTTTTIKFHVPTQLFLSLFDIGDNFYKEGIDWSKYTAEDILGYAQYGFGILDNILIYLFDPEYYNLRYVKSVGSKHYPSLYVNAVDMYFDDVSNPIIPGNVFSGSNIPLFVPHSGLKNGEIIEMQIDGTSYTSSSNSHSHFDFDSALKYVNGETFKPSLKDGLDEKRMNLVLHNSFANNLRQYNYRTAYFIKETAPLYSPSDDNRPKSVADFFNRGIKVTYFRPQKIAQNIGNKTQSITTAQTIRKQLKIYASMIASKYQYIDNSYIINSDIGKTISKEDDKNYSYSIEAVEQGCIPDSYYLFNSKQAYCSAVRNNLIFYSTAGTNEYGQFLHTPLLALESPNKFTPSQTIQTPTLTSKGIAKGTELKYYSLVTGPVRGNNEEQNFKLTGVKDMLYRDGYEKEVAPSIDIVWGRRQVGNYIKKKQLQYILIERELGDRHSIYAPTYVEIIAADGFLHDREGLMSKYVATYPVKWYGYPGNDTSKKFQLLDTEDEYAPREAIYGLVDLASVIKGKDTRSYSGNYLIRIYSKSNKKLTDGEIYNFDDLKLNSDDFIITDYKPAGGNPVNLVRRPIIKRIYFLGQSYSGARNDRTWDNKD